MKLHSPSAEPVAAGGDCVGVAARYADLIVALYDGEFVASGPPAEVLTGDLLRSVFGIEATIIDDPLTGAPLMMPIQSGMRANYIGRLVSALLWIAESLGDPEIARLDVPAFVSRMSSKSRAGIIEIEHEGRYGVYQQRGGCCLNYRIPGNAKCDTCSLLPLDERLAIFRTLLTDDAETR